MSASYDDWRRRRTCTGKVRRTLSSARRAARELGPDYTAYRCAFCGRWHVGHHEGREPAIWNGRRG